ncbi:hypothetical protein [Siphonobacter sp.]|uniref:hypothetical protein n=1 Tax=Siphonobacter sp. TaxID=1869184 RepID=UPI003B3A1414
MKNILTPLALLACLGFIMACEKAEDPFVPREVAPALVQIVNATYQTDFATEPNVPSDSTAPLALKIRVLKLDKTNILDHTKGIDSIPVPNLNVKLLKRDGTALGEGTTDASGTLTLTKTWAELGIVPSYANPPLKYYKGQIVRLSWTGAVDGVAFTRLSSVSVR